MTTLRLHWHITQPCWAERWPASHVDTVPQARTPGEEIIVQLPNHREIWTTGYSKVGVLTWLDNKLDDVAENVPWVVRWAWTTR